MTRYVDLYPVNVEISINSISYNGNNALVRIRGRCNLDNSKYNNSFLRPRAASCFSFATNRVDGSSSCQQFFYLEIRISRNIIIREIMRAYRTLLTLPFKLGETEYAANIVHIPISGQRRVSNIIHLIYPNAAVILVCEISTNSRNIFATRQF